MTIVVCEPPPEAFLTKALPSAPALVISLIALAISGYTVRYNFKKDARAREQSIQDDFWLRKVVSPVSIEPFVKFSSSLIAELPDATTAKDAIDAFAKDRLTQLRGLTAAFRSLELIGGDLTNEVEAHLERLEDRLATYLAALDAYASGLQATPPGRPEAVTELSELRLRVLEPIKKHQALLGHSSTDNR